MGNVIDTVVKAVKDLYHKLGPVQFIGSALGIFLLMLISFRVGIVILKIVFEVILSPIGLLATFALGVVAIMDYLGGGKNFARVRAAIRNLFTHRPSEGV